MHAAVFILAFIALAVLGDNQAEAADCKSGKGVLGVSRVVELDTTGGPRHGHINYGESDLLKDKEVIITFDDGPAPGRTERILKALAKECTKATFFSVGTMAMAYPDTLRKVDADGHTIAGHTWSHENLGRRSPASGKVVIEKGFAALSAVLGKPVAPFFRFPFLRETRAMNDYLARRDVGLISVDVVSGDTDGYGPQRLLQATMKRLKVRGRGILLFHDIKRATAQALPSILRALRKGGYKVVHLRAKASHTPVQRYAQLFEKRLAERGKSIEQKRRLARMRANMPVPSKRTEAVARRFARKAAEALVASRGGPYLAAAAMRTTQVSVDVAPGGEESGNAPSPDALIGGTPDAKTLHGTRLFSGLRDFGRGEAFADSYTYANEAMSQLKLASREAGGRSVGGAALPRGPAGAAHDEVDAVAAQDTIATDAMDSDRVAAHVPGLHPGATALTDAERVAGKPAPADGAAGAEPAAETDTAAAEAKRKAELRRYLRAKRLKRRRLARHRSEQAALERDWLKRVKTGVR